MTNDVRLATARDLDGYSAQLGLSFHRRFSAGEAEFMGRTFDFDRTRVAMDGSRVVGTLRSWTTEFTVPGPHVVRASALTNVTVAPTHRRRGILTEMITQDLRDSAARGEAIGILIASEYPIYGRFGYGPAIENAGYRIDTTGLHAVAAVEGNVELSDLATLRVDGPAVYEQFRTSQPGSIERHDWWWDRLTRQIAFEGLEPRKGFCARYVAPDGTVEGYVLCSGNVDAPDMRHVGVLTVDELIAATPRAYRALWIFCTNVDLLTTVVAADRAVDEPIGLLFDNARAVHLTHTHDFIWIRILDVVTALEGRSFSAPGRVVLDVADDMGFANGRFILENGPDGPRCTETTDVADLRLSVAALGSVYAGDVSLSALATAGWVEVINDAALETADAMFRSPRRAWCATWF